MMAAATQHIMRRQGGGLDDLPTNDSEMLTYCGLDPWATLWAHAVRGAPYDPTESWTGSYKDFMADPGNAAWCSDCAALARAAKHTRDQ